MSLLKYDDYDEVIRRANQSRYGLAAGVWTQSLDRSLFLARGLRAGTVWINCYDEFDAAIPFGGYKQSGVGRDKGEYALNLYTETKLVQMPIKGAAWK